MLGVTGIPQLDDHRRHAGRGLGGAHQWVGTGVQSDGSTSVTVSRTKGQSPTALFAVAVRRALALGTAGAFASLVEAHESIKDPAAVGPTRVVHKAPGIRAALAEDAAGADVACSQGSAAGAVAAGVICGAVAGKLAGVADVGGHATVGVVAAGPRATASRGTGGPRRWQGRADEGVAVGRDAVVVVDAAIAIGVRRLTGRGRTTDEASDTDAVAARLTGFTHIDAALVDAGTSFGALLPIGEAGFADRQGGATGAVSADVAIVAVDVAGAGDADAAAISIR